MPGPTALILHYTAQECKNIALYRYAATAGVLTFGLPARTLPIVIYGRYRIVLSLLIVLGLAVLFLWGGFHLVGSLTSSAAPAVATPTLTPVVEQPTIVPTATPKPKTSATGAARPTPTGSKPSSKGPAPHPTAKPKPSAPPKVFVTTTLADTKGATTFHVGPTKFFCRVRNSALPAGPVSLNFTWTRDQPNGFLIQYALARFTGDYTTGYYESPILTAPNAKYRCDVSINGQPLGSAHFAILP